ncbi:MAG: DNA topoisomerase I [Candidatus Woesearchaeota archaeon]
MYELIITEKPAAAKKIADALADTKATKEVYMRKIPFYRLTHDGKEIIVTCAVGHLYGLAEKKKNGWTYPIYDIEWKPSADINKAAKFTKQYLASIKKLAKGADEFTVATDYDIEGEVIGLNVVRFACGKKDASRMKFSTLTKEDLIEAYEKKSKTLDWGQANAGETRHKLDWFYGINTSRALTAAIKTAGMFKLMSSGRVQGPTLKLIVDKEKEIQAFKPAPYWQIQLLGEKNKQTLDSWHEKDKFWEKDEASTIYNNIKSEKTAKIKDVQKKKFNQAPPNPFDLTSLQIEAYRTLRISPKNTLAIAQDLYTAGYISYPRTSSQKLPAKLGFKKIIEALSKAFPEETKILLKKSSLIPNEGKKEDAAHPAIYPTGTTPKLKDKMVMNIYELITRRFLATFGDPATRETMNINIACKGEIFLTKGTTTIIPGWHLLYGRFTPAKEEELPAVNKGDELKVKKIELHDKETLPPKRYTDASIIKELEKRGLGTKATRASIVDTLFQRDYIGGKPIEATGLGMRTISTLEKHNPRIIDQELTKHFEVEMEEIRSGKKTSEDVISEAKEILNKIMDQFRKEEKEIGKELSVAHKETRDDLSTLGPCQNCKDGLLQIRRGKFGMFIACNKYPDCKTTFSLPANALSKPAKEICEVCNHPKILVIKRRKQPQKVCINPKCPSKLEGYAPEKLKEMEDIESGKLVKECPKCKVGHLKVRKSVYGSFIACDAYPKCRYVETLDDDKKDYKKKDFKKKKSS